MNLRSKDVSVPLIFPYDIDLYDVIDVMSGKVFLTAGCTHDIIIRRRLVCDAFDCRRSESRFRCTQSGASPSASTNRYIDDNARR